MLTPTREQYEPWEGGVCHKPTGTRVSLAFQNERGEFSFNILKGNPGHYIERAVEELGAQIILEGIQSERWECPLCFQVVVLPKQGMAARLPPNFHSRCKLPEHLCGNECLAYRQETKAKSLYDVKRELQSLEAGTMRWVGSEGAARSADRTAERIAYLRASLKQFNS